MCSLAVYSPMCYQIGKNPKSNHYFIPVDLDLDLDLDDLGGREA